MLFLRPLIISVLIAIMAVASSPTNYSVQLMEGLAPAGWSKKDWAAAADTMIGKARAHILTDLIEDLAIKLKTPESSIRQQIDSDRIAKGLEPMPPHEEELRGLAALTRHMPKVEEDYEDYTNYLPPGWTEEKFETHTITDLMELTNDEQQKINKRQTQDPNPGRLNLIPPSVMSKITSKVHFWAAKQLGLPPSVPVWKRSLAPIVQVLTLQSYEQFGFILYRTSYKDEAAWEKSFETLAMINEAQMENTMEGEGLEVLEDRLLMPMDAEDDTLDGASADDCRKRFKELRDLDAVPSGLDVGILLMVDESSIKSLGEEYDYANPPFVWVVDVDYDPLKHTYPEGYEGMWKVTPACLLHHLWVAVASGVMSPVEVWGLLGKKELPVRPEGAEKGHDEL